MQVVASVAEIMFEDEDGRLRQISSLDSAAVAGVCAHLNIVFLWNRCLCGRLVRVAHYFLLFESQFVT